MNGSIEIYILKQIKELEKELEQHISQKDATYKFGTLELKVYPGNTYWNKFHRLTGQINILYKCLTAHDNKYNGREEKKDDKE